MPPWLCLLVACVAYMKLAELVTCCQVFLIRSECEGMYGAPLGPPFITGSNIDCAAKCANHDQCVSFIYSNRTLQCLLNPEIDQCSPIDCADGLFYGEMDRAVTIATNCVTSPVDPLLRLCDGSGQHEGRLEVFHEGTWGTVCDDVISYQASWGSLNANVVCRMFGYGYGTARIRAYFGRGQGCIWMDEIQCVGTEASVFDCPRNPWAVHDCGHHEDVGVTCFNSP